MRQVVLDKRFPLNPGAGGVQEGAGDGVAACDDLGGGQMGSTLMGPLQK